MKPNVEISPDALKFSSPDEPFVEVKLSYVQGLIESAVSQAAALLYVKNALNAGVPNDYILSMLDGQKHWRDFDDISKIMQGPFYGNLSEMEENDGNS